MAKPVISYPGGKWRFYKHMREYFPKDMKVFIEPFLGGASVSLSVADDTQFTKLERIVVGELYSEVYNFWRMVKERGGELVELLDKTYDELMVVKKDYISFEGNKESEEFKRLEELADREAREIWEKLFSESYVKSASELERAARFYIISKISYSSLADSGYLSFSRYTRYNKWTHLNILDAQKIMGKFEIYNQSFEETMKEGYLDPKNTFVFLDPPYWKQEESALYGRMGSTHKNFPHDKFVECTRDLPCKWFITYDDSTYVRRKFKGKDNHGNRIYVKDFKIGTSYLLAGKASEDALDGEELFIANYNIKDTSDRNIYSEL